MKDTTEPTVANYFRSLVGGLIYLTQTRPDIAFDVGVISRFMHSPSKHHLGVAKRVLRYVEGTKNFGLWFGRIADFRLEGFTDNDWAVCLDDRMSTSGYVFNFGTAVVCWSSKKQHTTALSSSEAEFVAASSEACHSIWMRYILAEIYQAQDGATVFYCDNKDAIQMTRNPVYHGRTKHLDIKVNYVMDLVAEEQVVLEYLNTNE
ncbi:secreted RxLR effector protein 161-like [Apium graveolens]|uniref:secreted RxLR effector protein 161-like n=1 Tax=Apium graveolens TaxID=4045 RepID=UPI003D796EBE